MVGIIGSGFGLYGYLPALIRYGTDQVVLLERYQPKFFNRPELSFCEKHIVWVKDEETLLSKVEFVFLSLNPSSQVRLIEKCFSRKNIKSLCLEKPLAVTPSLSTDILKKLIGSKKTFRIAYTFRYTDWALKLNDLLTSGKPISRITIEWSFLAHHYGNNLYNWKRYNDSGGGVIRFFGIHLIALSYWLGYQNIVKSITWGLSENDLYKWELIIENNTKSLIDISIDSKSNSKYFSLKAFCEKDSRVIPILEIRKEDPFINESNMPTKLIDPRVDVLTNLIRSIFDENENLPLYEYYLGCNKLWRDAEFNNINCISS